MKCEVSMIVNELGMDAQELGKNFLPNEEVISCEKYGNGHINVTFLTKFASGKVCILQKINNNIFKNVDMLMNNIKIVTEYLTSKGIESIQMINSVTGKNYFEYEGNYYRMYEFIKDSVTVEKAESLEMVETAARSFGKFHKDLAGLDGSKLGETIPDFHNTRKRYQDFLASVERNASGRRDECLKEIEEVKKYAEVYTKIVDSIKTGEVKLHVTHNDPKINNALFDANTHKFRAVIDLDTIMPGSVLYDVGDALRSLLTGDKEDSLDYKSVNVNFDIYKHYVGAYYSEAKSFLTPRELELLPYAPFILTMECGMRFLADFIDGDKYFHVTREKHNLDRARTQINLAKSIFDNIQKLGDITIDIIKTLWLLKMQKLF